MNKLAVILGLAIGLFVASSCRLGSAHRRPHLTGTCEGACDHYLACKKAGDTAAHEACVTECRDVLQDEESLRAFESLGCKDTIEYVEGDSGRGPGQLIGTEHGD